MSNTSGHGNPLLTSTPRRIVLGSLQLVIFAAIWFAIAGRVNWFQGWITLVTFTSYVAVLSWRLSVHQPELFKERNRPAADAEPWDRAVMLLYSVLLIGLLVVSALDGGRYRWSTVPLGVQLLGWSPLVGSGLVIWHVMMMNPYLSSWARIQQDRGQVVVQEGAYGIIRHPMYLGIILAMIGMPLVLGSWWAMVPAAMTGGLMVYRTYREDRMLLEGLAGYQAYAERVRYRLVPGLW